MTEKEAIRILGDTTLCTPLGQAAFVAIEAIKMLQQYRALGTVEELAEVGKPGEIKTLINRLNAVIAAQNDKLKDYEKLGTLEELREAWKKRIPKIPYIWGDGYSEGHPVYDMYDCPNCGESYEIDGEKYNFCPNCGQAIDWRWEKNETD